MLICLLQGDFGHGQITSLQLSQLRKCVNQQCVGVNSLIVAWCPARKGTILEAACMYVQDNSSSLQGLFHLSSLSGGGH